MKTVLSTSADPLAVRRLTSSLESHDGFADAIAQLKQGQRATFDGAWGSASALLAATLQRHAPAPVLAVCAQASDVDELVDDLKLFTDADLWTFPAWEVEPNEQNIHDDVYGDRLRTLKRLLSWREVDDARPPLIATSVESLLQPTPSRDSIQKTSRWLRQGDTLDVDETLRWLVGQHFHTTSAVQLPGEFSQRGGILDVFAPDWQRPIRIELFGDQIESIRQFDVNTQRSLAALEEVEVTVLEPTTKPDAYLTDYLPPASWVMLIEPELLQQRGEAYVGRLERPDALHTVSGVMTELSRFALASAAGLSPGTWEVHCCLQTESVERFSGEVGRVREELSRTAQDASVFVVTPTAAEVKRLTEIFSGTSLLEERRLQFVIGRLRRGFRLVPENTVLVSADELFHRAAVRRVPRRHLGKAIDSFLDLRPGDLVVHLSHGIGRYRGIELLDKQGQVEEHLQIEFAESAKLYVPATKIDLVQKYVGGRQGRPSLARLGGTSWLRHKRAAEAAVQDMAAEMLELQAERLSRPGIAASPDGQWQQEFDASFPYEETDDQRQAIDSIKADMESPRPMDRLLCGDVGFGKTEVAMRAAFKAVDNGYQVAVLVPTTILAEQHYQTFSERMAEFPFDIGRLSRFSSTKEQRELIEALAAGRVEVVIGTHRLASRDVRFHNLGLVIIDEEQRFGVEVKERLKSLRSTVDVLTMTATPIPRTLHMSLVGVRDISNLETAPEDRVAVETRVTRFNAEVIRHAVMRELNRGGQIFFVHNRVQDIEVVAQKLRQIVPEATIGIGHGQMREDELEKVMVDFVAHRFDLLLATTIVENGLDIPNANTIFVDEADRYGLADLHQLRGRVGRYKHRAFCYLLIDPHKHITPNAAKRLRAIEEYSEMGAGFALSMRDLEIRGAGNLLGAQQSGHIAAVGYEFYCQLLENAVRSLKKLPRKLSVDVDIDLPVAAYLPDDYIQDLRLKIDVYRRLRRTASYDELEELRGELLDRFGPLPEPVQQLLDLSELKLDAAVWQISAIFLEEGRLVFRYTDRRRVQQLKETVAPELRIVDDSHAYLDLAASAEDSRGVVGAAQMVLRPSSLSL